MLVKTADGLVSGVSTATTRQFLGIPFAQPPVGALRWQAPQPPTPWSSTLDADKASGECPQITPVVNVLTGNEDCL